MPRNIHIQEKPEEENIPLASERIEDVAPNELPPIAVDFVQNPFTESTPVKLPEPDKETLLDQARKRLKIVHEKVVQTASPLDGNKLKLAEDGSELASNILYSVMGLAFSLLGDEYVTILPRKEQLQQVVYPLARIFMRHSKIAGEISPDYIDASAAIKASVEIVKEMNSGIRQIRWMKANGYVMVPQGVEEYARAGQASSGSNGTYTATNAEPNIVSPNGNYQGAVTDSSAVNGRNASFDGQSEVGAVRRATLGTIGHQLDPNISADDRAKHDKLLELTQRDITSRRRRAGFFN